MEFAHLERLCTFGLSHMAIIIIKDKISLGELTTLAHETFGEFVKAVVDIEKEAMALGGELHADEESALLKAGSNQRDLWGINLYPGKFGEDWMEFNSMINVRPVQENRSRGVENAETQEKIKAVVKKLVA